ncbi:MAG: GNAT family N-acetyltransferase [Gammaproteobacteria bacterium]|nr:GNAT family N-acetyltransferase [Gammaproteobacteria bacterium]
MIKVRKQIDADAAAVKFIVAVATDELRSIYRPVKNKAQKDIEKSVSVVAIINESVVGTAEYLVNKNNILVRGLAVSPVHRRQGVARAIIAHVMSGAQKAGRAEVVLSTIRETGNVDAFLRMGFSVASEAISETFEGVQGEPVTVVNMSKKTA